MHKTNSILVHAPKVAMAHAFTQELAHLGVIEIVSKGKPGQLARKAAEFRYLLPETENIAEEDDDEIPV